MEKSRDFAPERSPFNLKEVMVRWLVSPVMVLAILSGAFFLGTMHTRMLVVQEEIIEIKGDIKQIEVRLDGFEENVEKRFDRIENILIRLETQMENLQKRRE